MKARNLVLNLSPMSKIVYNNQFFIFSALFPYVMMTVLLVYGMIYDYEGSKIGILGYITPDWEKVQELSVWKEAAIQIVFSLGLGNGVLGTSASYNQFHNNCLRDAIAVVLINCASIL